MTSLNIVPLPILSLDESWTLEVRGCRLTNGREGLVIRLDCGRGPEFLSACLPLDVHVRSAFS